MNSRYRLKIIGRNPDYFVQKLIQQGIFIYFLQKSPRQLIVVVDQEGFLKIQKIKTTYRYQVIERYGFAKITYLLRKYAIFLSCFLLGILLNLFLSQVIFEVEVIHSNSNIREMILEDLKQAGISKFRFKVSFSEKEKIVEEILKKETNDIEWMEIEEQGTKYVVRVEQRKKNQEAEVCEARNIVAKKDAMILEIRAEEGEVVAKKLDYVKKGDVIISGTIHNKEDIVSKKCAVGQVFGEVWYQVHLELPKNYYEENVTGKEKKQLEIQFLNHNYTLFHKFEHYQKKSIPLLESFLFPIGIYFSTYLETEVIEETYTLENVDSKAISLATSKLENKLGEEDVILSKNVLKKTEKESKIIVEVFFKVKEDITDTADIVEEVPEEKVS